MSGQRSYYAGLAAENSVARLYEQAGHRIVERRWRGASGEIDIIAEKDDALVFVEVKASRSHARAAQSLSVRQQHRLMRAAEEYAGRLHGHRNVDMRLDVALMDGVGQITLLENALMAA